MRVTVTARAVGSIPIKINLLFNVFKWFPKKKEARIQIPPLKFLYVF